MEHIYSLEFSDDCCEWRTLLHLERVSNLSKLKVFDARMGKFIKQLLWVFILEGILPYKNLCWSERLVECQVAAQEIASALGLWAVPMMVSMASIGSM